MRHAEARAPANKDRDKGKVIAALDGKQIHGVALGTQDDEIGHARPRRIRAGNRRVVC